MTIILVILQYAFVGKIVLKTIFRLHYYTPVNNRRPFQGQTFILVRPNGVHHYEDIKNNNK